MNFGLFQTKGIPTNREVSGLQRCLYGKILQYNVLYYECS